MKFPLPAGFRDAAEAAQHFRTHDMTPEERTAADLILNSPSRWDKPKRQVGLFSAAPPRESCPVAVSRLQTGAADPVGVPE